MSRAVFTSRWCDPYLPVQNGLTTEGEIISCNFKTSIGSSRSNEAPSEQKSEKIAREAERNRARGAGVSRMPFDLFIHPTFLTCYSPLSVLVSRSLLAFERSIPNSRSTVWEIENVARSILAKCEIFRLFARTLHRQKISIVATFRDLYRPETNLSRTSNAGRSSRPPSLPETRVSGTARASPPPAGR